MDGTSLLVGSLAGGAAGAAVGWLLARARAARVLAEAEGAANTARAGTAAAEAERERASVEVRGVRESLAAVEKAHAALGAQLESGRKAVDEARERMRDEFQASAAAALKGSNESFLQLAGQVFAKFQQGAAGDLESRQKAIEALLAPVREALAKVETTIQTVEKDRAGAYGKLDEQLHSLRQGQVQLTGETANLVKALRAPQVRGSWGEVQLRNIVELAGMVEHCDFVVQASVDTEEGRLRPDLVVRLPGGRRLIVDAKVPLAAWLEAMETADEAARETLFRDHARQVRDHATKLGAKNYWDQLEGTPEFVVMFVPNEGLLAAAFQHDRGLIEYVGGQRVVLAGPLSLLAVLRTVARVWGEARIAESARKVSELGQELHDRLARLADHFQKVGRGLAGAVGAYNEAVGSLETRVLVTARKFRDLGVPSATEIPEVEVVDRAPREIQAPEMRALPGRGAAPGETAA